MLLSSMIEGSYAFGMTRLINLFDKCLRSCVYMRSGAKEFRLFARHTSRAGSNSLWSLFGGSTAQFLICLITPWWHYHIKDVLADYVRSNSFCSCFATRTGMSSLSWGLDAKECSMSSMFSLLVTCVSLSFISYIGIYARFFAAVQTLHPLSVYHS